MKSNKTKGNTLPKQTVKVVRTDHDAIKKPKRPKN